MPTSQVIYEVYRLIRFRLNDCDRLLFIIRDDCVEEQQWRSLGPYTDRTISRRVFADRRKLESEKLPRIITAVDPDDENTGRDCARTLAVAQNHTSTETPCNAPAHGSVGGRRP